MVGRAPGPELGMVFRDKFEVDEDGQTLTEVLRHDFYDVTIAARSAGAEAWWHLKRRPSTLRQARVDLPADFTQAA